MLQGATVNFLVLQPHSILADAGVVVFEVGAGSEAGVQAVRKVGLGLVPAVVVRMTWPVVVERTAGVNSEGEGLHTAPPARG